MKAAVWKVPSVPVCILGSGTLQAPPSRETATPGNWGCSVVWEGCLGAVEVKLGQEGQWQVEQGLAWAERKEIEMRGWFGEGCGSQ